MGERGKWWRAEGAPWARPSGGEVGRGICRCIMETTKTKSDDGSGLAQLGLRSGGGGGGRSGRGVSGRREAGEGGGG